ncbi:uncharacterized protein PG998_010217 [Apiospora kogelbergensis]|uniref:Dynamin GTPase domain-containing protein n=1 Tax=Apiospora kogelbergensis TaxID=1337665 RepID=A0AAW0R9V7_9PEZI
MDMEEDNQAVDLGPIATIDKLRKLNVGTLVPLPQLVAVGYESSEKILVLENITGFSFPCGVGLYDFCTTEITCRPASELRITISIIPRPNADEQVKRQLLDFKHELPDVDGMNVVHIFKKAEVVMGIRMSEPDNMGNGRSAVSQDILKIEICGPQQDILTVINIPDISRTAKPGITSDSDIALVNDMAKSYMNDRRTTILAIAPSNVEFATPEILKLTETADPSGARTMVILTKPDLATLASRWEMFNVILGKEKERDLKLGYHIVKNR